MQLIYVVFMAIMQMTRSVLFWQVFTVLSVYWYVGESFCNNYASDCFCCSYAVRGFCSTNAGDSFCSKYMGDNFYCNYVDGCLCCNYAGGIFCSAFMHDCVYCDYAGDFPLQLTMSRQFKTAITWKLTFPPADSQWAIFEKSTKII